MKVSLVWLLLFPLSLLFGQQELRLQLEPLKGLYQGQYTHASDTATVGISTAADVHKGACTLELNHASYQHFSYASDTTLSDYALLSKRSWNAWTYQTSNVGISLLDDGKDLTAMLLKVGTFSCIYLAGPKVVDTEAVSLIWDHYLLGRNLLMQYRYEGKEAFCTVEGIWGEFHRGELSTTLGLHLGPLTLQSSYNGRSFLEQRSCSLRLQEGPFLLSHTQTMTFSDMPIYSGRYQTMKLSACTTIDYLQFHARYEQTVLFDGQGEPSQKRELLIRYRFAALQAGVLFSDDESPVWAMQNGNATISYQSNNLSVAFAIQRRRGSITLRLDPHKGLTLSYTYTLTNDRRNESLLPT